MMLIDETTRNQLVCENLRTIIYIKYISIFKFCKFNGFSDRLTSIHRMETERKRIRFILYVLTF